MALNKLNFRKHSQQLRVALAGILALVLVLGTGVQSHATTPDGAYIYHIQGNDLFIGSGASSERKPAALKNQLRGNTILYVPAGKRGSANLGFIVDAPLDSAGLLVQAGPHNVASQWSFPCTASGGFKLAWKQGGERGCEEGVRMKRSGSQRSRLTLPNDQGLLAAKSILKAQADEEEVIVAPPSSESSVAQVYESANGIEVETIQGNILVKSAKNPQGRLIPEGQRYSYPQDTTAPIDRNAILQTPEMQDFLNPSNWSSPDIPQRISDSIAEQLGQHRTALGLPSPSTVASNVIAIPSGSGRITRSEYPNVVPVGTSVSQVSGAYNPSTGKILLEIEGRQAEISLNAPLSDGTPISFTVTQIIPRDIKDPSWGAELSRFPDIVRDALIKEGIQTQGTLIKQGNQIQGKFASQARWRPDGGSRGTKTATNGSVDGEFALTLQPGETANTPVFRNYTAGTWYDAVPAGW